MIGIYKITNLINQKVYIGQSTNIEKRWAEHQRDYKYKDYILYQAFNKYGIENFSFDVIEECSVDQLDEREIYWITYYDSYNNGYNATLGGETGRKYDYDKIKNMWDNGYTVKEIQQEIGCASNTLSAILRVFNISKEETYARSRKTNIYTALDSVTEQPLKSFYGTKEIANFFQMRNGKTFKTPITMCRGIILLKSLIRRRSIR